MSIITDSGVQGRPVLSPSGQVIRTGEVTDVVLSNVQCTGNEESIFNCFHQNNECPISAAVSIGCPRKCHKFNCLFWCTLYIHDINIQTRK